jgi:hypothetical protein
MTKNILLITGVGLSDVEDLEFLFTDRKCLSEKLSLHSNQSIIGSFDVSRFDLIVLRGPWVATPEEKLYGAILAHKLESLFKKVKAEWAKPNSKLKILALGRGALAVLESPVFWNPSPLVDANWERRFIQDNPWLQIEWLSDNADLKSDRGVKMSGLTKDGEISLGNTFAFGNQVLLNGQKNQTGPKKKVAVAKEFVRPWALLQGRAFPIFSPEINSHLDPWLKAQSVDVGWKSFQKRLCFSLVDFLAYEDRTQNQNFGYVDLTQQPTRIQVLDHFLNEG